MASMDDPQAVRSAHSLSFWEHVSALRGVVLRCVVVVLIGCVIVGCFFPVFADMMNYPLRKALGTDTDALQGLVTTSPMGIFSVLVQVCLMGGTALAMPLVLFFIARFVAPGLEPSEKRILLPGCIAVLALFLIGASFSYFFVLPASLAVSIELNQLFGFELIWAAPQYYGLVVWMTLGIGMCFEFPLALLLLVQLGVLSSAKLKGARRYAIVGSLVAGGLITPSGDPFSLAMLFVPLYGLYEISIIVARKMEARRARMQEQWDSYVASD